MKCIRCGRRISRSASFCTYCGSEQPVWDKAPGFDWNAFYRIFSGISFSFLGNSLIVSLTADILFPYLPSNTNFDALLFSSSEPEFWLKELFCLLIAFAQAVPPIFLCSVLTKSAKSTMWLGIYTTVLSVVLLFDHMWFLFAPAMGILIWLKYRSDAQSQRIRAAYQEQTVRLNRFANLLGYSDFQTLIRNDPHLQSPVLAMQTVETQMTELAHAYGWRTFYELEALARDINAKMNPAEKLRSMIRRDPQVTAEPADTNPAQQPVYAPAPETSGISQMMD